MKKLGDKNLDSEEYAMLSTGVYPPIFHSFRKKGIFWFRFSWRYVLKNNRLPYNNIYNDNQLLPYYMVNADQMVNSGYHYLKKLMLNYVDQIKWIIQMNLIKYRIYY